MYFFKFKMFVLLLEFLHDFKQFHKFVIVKHIIGEPRKKSKKSTSSVNTNIN